MRRLVLLFMICLVFLSLGSIFWASQRERSTIPAYPQATVVEVKTLASHLASREIENGGSVQLTRMVTRDVPESVLDFYSRMLPRLGWEPITSFEAGALYRRLASDGVSWQVAVTAAPDWRDTSVTNIELLVTYRPKRGHTYRLPPQFTARWGAGKSPMPFRTPTGIAITRDGKILVLDSGHQRVQVFDQDGAFILSWGSPGEDAGQLGDIIFSHVVADRWGNIYIADTGNSRVQKFTWDGTFLTLLGAKGTGPGQFLVPYGVAADNDGNVYVADTGNHRIQKFDSEAQLVAIWGYEGTGIGEFKWPAAIAVDNDGFVYIADTENHRIQKFDQNGEAILSWGMKGISPGLFDRPSGLAVTSDQGVYVADWRNHRVQQFSKNGVFLSMWGSVLTEQFSLPQAVAVDEYGRIYVTDSGQNEIEIFQ